LTVKPGRDPTTGGTDYAIVDAEGYIVGEASEVVGRDGGTFVVRPAWGNALLWAAAPELLRVLEAVSNHVGDDSVRVGNQCTLCYTYRKMIRAAIAKARQGEATPRQSQR
jgi:hypothetical protein